MSLTLEQKREVASATIPDIEWFECAFGPNGGGLSYIADKSDPCNKPFWNPKKVLEHKWALAWFIANQFDILECAIPIDKHGPLEDLEREFIKAIRENDVEALETIAFELINT